MDGFQECIWKTLSGASIYSRYRHNAEATRRPLLVLLHGYPQNHMMWKEFVKGLPDDFDLVIPDLPGYGRSVKKPVPGSSHRAHSKKEWSIDIIEALQHIHVLRGGGQDNLKLIVYGHDRGARLAYRMALDAPSIVIGLAVLDIVPTPFMWARMSLSEERHDETKKSHHWIFLASPDPLPERLIASQAEFYFSFTMKSWTGVTTLAACGIDGALAEWQRDSIAPFLTNDQAAYDRISAACEDYRAGSTVDVEDDLASGIDPEIFHHNKQDAQSSQNEPRIPVFSMPVLVLSSAFLRRRFPVDEIWKSLCARNASTCLQIGDEGTGHFFVNEATEETLGASIPWLTQFK